MNDADVFFQKLGWTKLPDTEQLSIYATEYAAVGLVSADSSEEVLSRWQGWQTALFNLKTSQAIGRKRDLYLLVLLEEENFDALKPLQEITDDTHVCRKVVLSRRGRTIARTLMDTSLFQMVEDPNEPNEWMEVTESVLGTNVLGDLAKKSAHAIFDNLLEAKYRASAAEE